MNAVEIEEAISQLAEAPFDGAAFPYAFLEAFGSKVSTVLRLHSGAAYKNHIIVALLRPSNNIHLCVVPAGELQNILKRLRNWAAKIRQIVENALGIRAMSRLNHLYPELIKDNPELSISTCCHETKTKKRIDWKQTLSSHTKRIWTFWLRERSR